MADTRNPYAPPAAAVADIVAGEGAVFQPVKVFGAKGRIGRMRYFAYLFSAWFIATTLIWVFLIIFGVVIGMLTAAGKISPDTVTSLTGATSMAILGIRVIVWMLYMIFHVRVTMQRCHDLDQSGWTALLTFIPFYVLYWIFAAGVKTSNRYGPPPPPNKAGIQVLFWICIVLMSLIFLAFVVVAIAVRQ